MHQWTIAFDSEHEENERTSYADIDALEKSTGSGWGLLEVFKHLQSYQ